MIIQRNEYPRPQLERKQWQNLNGEWDFELDNVNCGIEKEYFKREYLNEKITVPFCPESKLSGIGNTDFMNCVWYRKSFALPNEWIGKNILLNFGAVDYHAIVYVNGEYVGEHYGGYVSFFFDITKYIKDGENYISVCAKDDIRSNNQPSGKQSDKLNSYGCFYTRTTGIWQTVWLECTGENYITNIKTVSDIDNCIANLDVVMSNYSSGCIVEAKVYYDGLLVGEDNTTVSTASANMSIKLSEKHLWGVGKGNLYDIYLTVTKNGKEVDFVKSYFGMRSVGLTEKGMLINGKYVFGRFVLDQGFYPDGIYTAPSDEDLKNDIIYSMMLGFNGARLHEKVFEPRYLYWADKLGYLVWGEHANWGLNITKMSQIEYFLPEWLEILERDFNHPSIIGWCPFNETWDYKEKHPQCDMILETVYKVTKAVDKTRPVIDTSGNFHVITDIFDVHDYCQNCNEFNSHYKDKLYNNLPNRQKHNGEPYFVSEYGGIKWSENENDGWGYGDAPKTKEEFISRYKSLTETLLSNERIMGFCYTQLYDVEQEVNGLLTYDRRFKFDPEIIKEINQQKAAIEK